LRRPMSIALDERLRSLRKERGLSQEEVARRAGIGLKAYGELERGIATDPHFSTLGGIARALGMRVAELVGEESESSAAGKASAPREPGRQVAPEAMPGTAGGLIEVRIAEGSGPTRVEITRTSFFELMRNVKEGCLSEEDAWQRFQEEAG
jgi:transcriptional regulator with XRE-family HTH domain